MAIDRSLSVRVHSWRPVPVLLLGYDIRRWETPGGRDLYIQDYVKKFMWGIIKYVNNTRVFGPTHLQYSSPFGFLLTWPLCLHVWYQFRGQSFDSDGLRIPGSEKVFYWRFGARWDAGDEVYVVPSWYGPGLHWD